MLRDAIIATADKLEEARLEAKERADKGSYEVAWSMLNTAIETLVREFRRLMRR